MCEYMKHVVWVTKRLDRYYRIERSTILLRPIITTFILEKIFYIFIPRSGNRAKRGVVPLKVGNGSVLMGTEYLNSRFPIC